MADNTIPNPERNTVKATEADRFLRFANKHQRANPNAAENAVSLTKFPQENNSSKKWKARE
jgi:hypothetical protein